MPFWKWVAEQGEHWLVKRIISIIAQEKKGKEQKWTFLEALLFQQAANTIRYLMREISQMTALNMWGTWDWLCLCELFSHKLAQTKNIFSLQSLRPEINQLLQQLYLFWYSIILKELELDNYLKELCGGCSQAITVWLEILLLSGSLFSWFPTSFFISYLLRSLMRVPRQRIKIALRLWIPVLVLRIVVAEARSQVGGLSVFSLASTASVLLLLFINVCAWGRKRPVCGWLVRMM